MGIKLRTLKKITRELVKDQGYSPSEAAIRVIRESNVNLKEIAPSLGLSKKETPMEIDKQLYWELQTYASRLKTSQRRGSKSLGEALREVGF